MLAVSGVSSAAGDGAVAVLCCVGGFLGFVVFLFHGRHPWELNCERYDQPSATDVRIPHAALQMLKTHLDESNPCSAYQCMVAHGNWFFLHRHNLPPEFAHLWLVIRTRVNRMVHFHGRKQDWAERDFEKLRQETLHLVEKACLILEPSLDFEEEFATEDQSVRTISAPIDRNLVSMRS